MMRSQAHFLVLVAFMLATLSSAVGQEKKAELQIPPGVIYEKDVESGKGGDTTLHLDIARPEKSDKLAPCIVVIHGGGWRGGNFKVHVPQILEFAKRGYVSATVQYRLVPTARFPSQIEDVKCAVRYLRANADKYGINKERFGAVGFSAGAHLSALVALGTQSKHFLGAHPGDKHANVDARVKALVESGGELVDALALPRRLQRHPSDDGKLVFGTVRELAH
jgi:acetyl esterase/lipase